MNRIRLALAVFIIIVVFMCLFHIKTILPHVLYSFNLQSFVLPKLITCSNCNSFKYGYEIENTDFCGNRDVFLLIVVASHHPNIDARRAIRHTWGSVKHHKGLSIITLFMFGLHSDSALNLQVRQEAERYGDVVQAKFADRYNTLSNKTMMALEWINQNCIQAKYVLKSDDNTYTIPQGYVDYLVDNQIQPFIGGFCFTAWPIRNKKSKFYTPYNLYKSYFYPMHCWGPAYVMSSLALKQILAVAPSVLFLPWEDVYVSGICREAAGIPYIQIPGSNIRKHELTPCNIVSKAKSLHTVLPGEIVEIWALVNDSLSADYVCPLLTTTQLLYLLLICLLFTWLMNRRICVVYHYLIKHLLFTWVKLCSICERICPIWKKDCHRHQHPA